MKKLRDKMMIKVQLIVSECLVCFYPGPLDGYRWYTSDTLDPKMVSFCTLLDTMDPKRVTFGTFLDT